MLVDQTEHLKSIQSNHREWGPFWRSGADRHRTEKRDFGPNVARKSASVCPRNDLAAKLCASGERPGVFLVPKRILIVEDHADIREMMSTYLKLNDYDVVEAADGYEAVQQALKYKPDVILMDIAMPVLDGINSTRAIRKIEALADVPIVVLTAFGDFYRERAKVAGCNDVLQKPIDFKQLDALLRRHLS